MGRFDLQRPEQERGFVGEVDDLLARVRVHKAPLSDMQITSRLTLSVATIASGSLKSARHQEHIRPRLFAMVARFAGPDASSTCPMRPVRRRDNQEDYIMAKLSYLMTGLVLATGLPATNALAGDIPTIRVEFADLDLRSDAGVERLDDRLRRAIGRICGDVPRGGYVEALAARHCKAATLADVTPQRDAVILLARSGKGPRVARLEVKAAKTAN